MKELRVLCLIILMMISNAVFAFGHIHILNKTAHYAKGVLAMDVCDDHEFALIPYGIYVSPDTGGCLLVDINIRDTDTNEQGIPYESFGTDYQHFQVVMYKDLLKVVRRNWHPDP